MRILTIISFISGMPFMVLGWFVSVVRFSFDIGYYSNELGEFKRNSITHLESVIDKQKKIIIRLEKSLLACKKGQ